MDKRVTVQVSKEMIQPEVPLEGMLADPGVQAWLTKSHEARATTQYPPNAFAAAADLVVLEFIDANSGFNMQEIEEYLPQVLKDVVEKLLIDRRQIALAVARNPSSIRGAANGDRYLTEVGIEKMSLLADRFRALGHSVVEAEGTEA